MAAICILLLAAAVLLIPLFLIYLRAFHSPDRTQNDIFNIPSDEQYLPHRDHMVRLVQELNSRPYEPVSITSFDGLKLCARCYHQSDSAPLDICFHGYRGTAIRDMCGGIRISQTLGHNVLLVDQRAHGKSQGHAITFGIKERRDCLSWVEYAKKRYGNDVRIMLYGVSMGAATVLMASELVPSENVRGIIADSPYSSPKEIILKVCRDMHLPPKPVYPLILLAAKLFAHFSLTETTAAQAVKNARIPTMILHGEDDLFVPQEMSKTIADARSDVLRHTFPGAAHGISNIVETQRYNELVIQFINRCCTD